MPVSSKHTTQEEAKGSSEGEGRAKPKRRSKPTSKARAKKQRTKDRYAHAREDAQLEGLIPTTPEEALKPERVDPSTQGSQSIPELIAQAIRNKWATRDEIKPSLVDEMVAVVLSQDMRPKDKIAAFNALRMADRSQWEQDNPVEAGKAKGAASTVAVSVQSNMLAVNVLREALEHDIGRGEAALPSPTESGSSSNGRFDGEVEVGAASTED